MNYSQAAEKARRLGATQVATRYYDTQKRPYSERTRKRFSRVFFNPYLQEVGYFLDCMQGIRGYDPAFFFDNGVRTWGKEALRELEDWRQL